MTASRNTISDGTVVHLLIRDVPARDASHLSAFEATSHAPHPQRAQDPLWDTVSILRLRRALVSGSPSIWCNLLWLSLLGAAWTLLWYRPTVFDTFSRLALYSLTTISALSLFDKLVPRGPD